jgi:hypothetical protein
MDSHGGLDLTIPGSVSAGSSSSNLLTYTHFFARKVLPSLVGHAYGQQWLQQIDSSRFGCEASTPSCFGETSFVDVIPCISSAGGILVPPLPADDPGRSGPWGR